MKRIGTLIGVLCVALGMVAESVFVFGSEDSMNQTQDGYSVVIAQGSGTTAPAYRDFNGSEIRLYIGNTITLTGPSLTSVQLVCAKSNASNKEYADMTTDCGVLVSGGTAESATDWKVDVWSGESDKVVFTLAGKGQRQIQRIVINGAPVAIEDTETPLPTAEDMEPDYPYSEPTTLTADFESELYKAEYAFIDQNILVHCTQGSLIPATDTTLAYFNCNAGYDLTFTATKAISSVTIDGFVRKGFSATCEPGEIEYVTNEDMDIEGESVLRITGIHANSVTLHCAKQIRCYTVRLYFEDSEAMEEVQDTSRTMDFSAPACDILGRRVNKAYHGVVLQNGGKYMLR